MFLESNTISDHRVVGCKQIGLLGKKQVGYLVLYRKICQNDPMGSFLQLTFFSKGTGVRTLSSLWREPGFYSCIDYDLFCLLSKPHTREGTEM